MDVENQDGAVQQSADADAGQGQRPDRVVDRKELDKVIKERDDAKQRARALEEAKQAADTKLQEYEAAKLKEKEDYKGLLALEQRAKKELEAELQSFKDAQARAELAQRKQAFVSAVVDASGLGHDDAFVVDSVLARIADDEGVDLAPEKFDEGDVALVLAKLNAKAPGLLSKRGKPAKAPSIPPAGPNHGFRPHTERPATNMADKWTSRASQYANQVNPTVAKK